MNESLLWRTATRFHDWSNGEFLATLFGHAWGLGIIERVDWLTNASGEDRQPVAIDSPKAFSATLIERLCKAPEPSHFVAGGQGALSWTLNLLIPAFDPLEQRVDGISIAALVFDGERFADHQQSASLARAFRAVHGPDSTEYAGIHWYERWTDLSDSVYSPAVTYTPMFCGVMWANFLGPGHIEQFDRAMLTSSLPSQNCTWIDDRGLFLIAPASLAEIKAPDAEARLFALTDIFRAARRA